MGKKTNRKKTREEVEEENRNRDREKEIAESLLTYKTYKIIDIGVIWYAIDC